MVPMPQEDEHENHFRECDYDGRNTEPNASHLTAHDIAGWSPSMSAVTAATFGHTTRQSIGNSINHPRNIRIPVSNN